MRRQTERPKVDQRALILEVSAQLFGHRGVDGTSITDIAEQVHLSKATIYHYFVSKDEIYSEIVMTTLESLVASLQAAVSSAEAPDDQLRSYMRAYARFLEENFWAFTTMSIGFGGIQRDNQRSRAIQLRKQAREILRDIIRHGAKTGAFRRTDVSTTSVAVLSMLNWMLRWYNHRGPKRAVQFAADFADLTIKGLTARPSDPRKK
jgi:TetR/AcrR family transcriptional regulator, cholesterol catabolism regulator